jgi:hypothetical protein
MKSGSRSPIFFYIFSPMSTISLNFPSNSRLITSMNHRAIVSSSGETLFFITPEAIDQMMQIPTTESASPFNHETIIELYQNNLLIKELRYLNCSSNRMLSSPSQIPRILTPCSQKRETTVISSLCCLLGYFSDEWVDEPILGFLSIFSTQEKTTTQFNYNTSLAENIHKKFSKFSTEGMFRYSPILAYMFIFFQVDRFSFSM